MNDHPPKFLDSREPVCERFRISTRIENNPTKPDERRDGEETNKAKKSDRKPDGRYRIIPNYVLRGWQFSPFNPILPSIRRAQTCQEIRFLISGMSSERNFHGQLDWNLNF
jgi:hypothetical protein